MLKWPTVAEAWTYRDPQEVVDALMARSARAAKASSSSGTATSGPPSTVARDRYYTQARHFQIRHAMKGGR